MKNGYSICFNEWALDKDINNELSLLLIISSLSAEKGYCFASNKYLADLFDIREETISRKLKKLCDKEYITIEYEKKGCEITNRIIRLTKLSIHDCEINQSTIDQKVKENNISINNNNKLNEFNLYNNFHENKQCEDTTKSGTRCLRKSSFNINGKNYCNQHARDLIPNLKVKEERFKKPTLEEVQEYCNERNNGINAQNFIDFYESKGWMVGKSKMKNWRACIRTWENNRKTNTKEEPKWFNQEQDLQKTSEQDQEEMENLLNGLRNDS